MFFSDKETSEVVITLYSRLNFLCKRRRVSSVKAIVGTIMTTFFGFLIAINESIIKLFPKLVGALTARCLPLISFFNIDDCSR